MAGSTAKCPCGAALAVPRPAPVVDPHAPQTVMCRCPKCKETLVLPIQMAGTQSNCPACSALMVVPFPKGMARPNSLLDELTENDWNKVLNPDAGKSVEKNLHADHLAHYAQQIASEAADEFEGDPKTVYRLLVIPPGITLFLLFISTILVFVIEDAYDKIKDVPLALIIVAYGVSIIGSLIPMIAGALIKKGSNSGIVFGYVGAVCNFLFTIFGPITAIFLMIKLASPRLKAYMNRAAAKRAKKQG